MTISPDNFSLRHGDEIREALIMIEGDDAKLPRGGRLSSLVRRRVGKNRAMKSPRETSPSRHHPRSSGSGSSFLRIS
jgi:hypothetical protein